MDKKTAQILLDNLLARIVVDPETGQGTFSGILTKMEIDSLNMASAELACSEISDKPSESEPEKLSQTELATESKPEISIQSETKLESAGETDSEESKADNEATPVLKKRPIPTPKLDLTSLGFNAAENPEVKLCLDFGTAMSKAFASIIENNDVVDYLPLKLGHRASRGKSKSIYPVPSSLWISDEGKIYLGEKAIALSLQANPTANRERFDSLKKELILGLQESTPFHQPMRESLNPTLTEFSTGDAVTFYLGYLTDLACTELDKRYGRSRYVLRNFALPSWRPERREWGESLLRKMLVKAQIVADTFHDQWDVGIDISVAKSVLEEIDSLEKFPDYILSQGITEPLAVGSSRLRKEEPSRGLAIVVDVGAGTSDIALFVVVENPEKNQFNAFPVLDCNQSISVAGDSLDLALQKMICEKSTIKSDDPEYRFFNQNLKLKIRQHKEDLFRDGYCLYDFEDNVSVKIELEDFLHHDSVVRFKDKLSGKFVEIINSMKKGLVHSYGRGGFAVVLTGGGATLPMVKELAQGNFNSHGITVQKYEVEQVPEIFFGDEEVSTVYPQLAVAIGGTMPVLIDEKDAVDDPGIPSGQFVLDRNSHIW